MPGIDTDNQYWVGFDLGGTKMLSLILDNDFNFVSRERKKSKANGENSVSIDRIFKVIRSSIAKSGKKITSISGIGIGVPGTLDLAQGIILEAPNLGWKNVNLKKILEKEFSCPVLLSNDVDAGIFGEYKMGAAKNAHCALGVFPGTGIGGGMVYKNRIFTGKSNSCLEIGHIPVVPNGIRCGCGRYGCLETVASRLAISAAAAAAVYRGEAPALQKIAGTDISLIKSGTIAESIKLGDTKIEKIVINAASQLGRVIGGIINLLSPEIVVLGGGLVEALPSLFLNTIKKGVNSHAMPSLKDTYSIVTAKLGDDATAIGAAAQIKALQKGM